MDENRFLSTGFEWIRENLILNLNNIDLASKGGNKLKPSKDLFRAAALASRGFVIKAKLEYKTKNHNNISRIHSNPMDRNQFSSIRKNYV